MIDSDDNPVQIAYPFRRGANGDLVMDVQDTSAHALTRANVVLRYPLGYLADEPAFGIPWPEFINVPIDPEPIVEALREQVPDAGSIDSVEYADALGAAYRHIDLNIET